MRWFLVVLIASGVVVPASAQSFLEIAAGIKFCRTLKDDSQRLKCFDDLLAEKLNHPNVNPDVVEQRWAISEDKSPIDDSPQVFGILQSKSAEISLALRCRERKTEAIFFPRGTYLGSDAAKVIVRINDGKLIETRWSVSTNGQAAFAPSAVQFIRALPENGKLFIRATGYGGRTADGEFALGDVSILREKIAKACNWAN